MKESLTKIFEFFTFTVTNCKFSEPATLFSQMLIDLYHQIIFYLLIVLIVFFYMILHIIFYFFYNTENDLRKVSDYTKYLFLLKIFNFLHFFKNIFLNDNNGMLRIINKSYLKNFVQCIENFEEKILHFVTTDIKKNLEMKSYLGSAQFYLLFLEKLNEDLKINFFIKKNFHDNRFLLISDIDDATELELGGTFFPTLIILLILIPSQSFLYYSNSIQNPNYTIKVIGNQGYGNYEYDFLYVDNTIYKFGFDEQPYLEQFKYNNNYLMYHNFFSSNLLKQNELEYGYRLLEVDNYLVLPVCESIRFLITSNDVLHSGAVPSFGIKMDAVPGRLNEVTQYVKRPGIFFGQCSELCGIEHAFMPIGINVVDINVGNIGLYMTNKESNYTNLYGNNLLRAVITNYLIENSSNSLITTEEINKVLIDYKKNLFYYNNLKINVPIFDLKKELIKKNDLEQEEYEEFYQKLLKFKKEFNS